MLRQQQERPNDGARVTPVVTPAANVSGAGTLRGDIGLLRDKRAQYAETAAGLAAQQVLSPDAGAAQAFIDAIRQHGGE